MTNLSQNSAIEKSGPARMGTSTEDQVRTILDALPGGVLAAEVDSGRFIYANQTVCQMLGYSSEELLGMTSMDLHPPGAVPLVISQMEKTLRGESACLPEVSVLRKNGQSMDVALNHTFLELGGQKCILGMLTDITARKQAEAAWRESETRLKNILNNVRDVIWSLSYPRFEPIFISDSVETLYGHPRGAFFQNPLLWGEMVHPDDRGVVDQLKKDWAERGYAYRECRILRADGEVRWISERSRLAYGENGLPIRVDGATTDITERIRTEEALRESHQITAGIIQTLPARVFWKDRNFVYLGCNKSFARDAGFADPAELIGKDDFQMAWREQAELYREDDRQIIASGNPKLFFVEPQTTPDGKTIWLLTSKIPLRNAQGEITGVLGTYSDITERMRATEALRESETRFDQLAEQSRTIAWELDAEGRYTFVSHVVEQVLGYRPEEMVGRMYFYDLFPPAGREEFKKLAFEAGRRNERFTNFLNPALTKDGRQLWLSSNGIPLLDAAGELRGFRGCDTDITERKQMEEGLKTNRRLLAEAMDLAHLVNWEYDTATGLFTFDDRFYALYGTTATIEGGYQMAADVYTKKFVHPEDQHIVADEVGKALRASSPGYTSQVDHRIVRRDGAIRHMVVRSKIVKDEYGKTIKTFGVNQDITDRRRAEEERRKMSIRLRELAQHLQTVREEESRRLAVWLHDEVGQMLTRARMDAMLLESVPENAAGQAADSLSSLKRTLDDAVVMIQHISMDLRPAMLDDFGLVATLEWTIHESEKRLKIPIHFEIDHVPESLDDSLSVAFYRMARECLTNIARHAHATSVDIRLFGDGRWLSLVIQDNGRGMKPGVAESPTSFGLSQLRERATSLGGLAQFESKPGQGTTIRISAPLSRTEFHGGRK